LNNLDKFESKSTGENMKCVCKYDSRLVQHAW